MGARPSSFKVEPKPEKLQRNWSAQQLDIFNWFERHSLTNLVVRARAGTGKTTVIVEGVNRAPESDILVCAFNKRIAEELTSRIENGAVTVKTLHAIGYQMIRRQWRGIPVDQRNQRADSLTDIALKQTERELNEKTPYQIRRFITQLHTKLREMCPLDPTHEEATALAFRFDHVPDEGWGKYDLEFVTSHALAAVHHAATVDPTYDIGIDYADMIFLPLAWKLTARDYDLVVVDEAQDMTVAQLEIAQRVCRGRICVVGDDKQAIYGFRGADSSSLDRLKKELSAAELPLTVTYRCGRTIVARAQELVPDIVAAGSHEGQVETVFRDQMMNRVKPGDFVLSRLNAPLVSVTLQLLRKGVRARMAGRDLGKGIMAILKKLKVDRPGTSIEAVIEKTDQWRRQTCAKLAAYGQQDQMARIDDQAGMILAFAEDVETVRELMAKCEELFTDDEDSAYVLCSSVHKAKGLETDTVWVLEDTFYRRGIQQEEHNIMYVAITRAKENLFLVEENV